MRLRRDGCRELYYLAGRAPDGRGVSTDETFLTSAQVPLFTPRVLVPTFEVEQYAPSADGTRFLVLDYAGDQRDLRVQVVTDWRALARPR